MQALSKDEYLVKEGEICTQVVFIEEGVMRNYYEDTKGNEVTTYLVSAGWFNTSYTSFLEKVPSNENIQAVVDCKLSVLDQSTFSLMKQQSEFFSALADKLIIRGLQCKDERLSAYQTQDAKHRYKSLIDTQPSIAQNTPLQYIASYLGISRETLSRIRNKKLDTF
ncbi:MAG: Crp/Fnr family transcriptional regulator [Bacteroidota bacterium]